MRLWNFAMIPYLPSAQLRSQWRECVLIAKDLQEKGKTNHLLINILEEYPHNDFMTYCWYIYQEMHNRGFAVTLASQQKVFSKDWKLSYNPFENWHNKEYLRVCVCNLFEKYKFGRGKSRISQEEWDKILQGYKKITGEDWVL